jgi:hypothetical protein
MTADYVTPHARTILFIRVTRLTEYKVGFYLALSIIIRRRLHVADPRKLISWLQANLQNVDESFY